MTSSRSKLREGNVYRASVHRVCGVPSPTSLPGVGMPRYRSLLGGLGIPGPRILLGGG